MRTNLRQQSPQGMLRGTVISASTCVLLLLYLVLAGCSSSTDPVDGDDPPGTVVFAPNGQGQSLRLSETMDFSAKLDFGGPLTVNWYRGGQVVGNGSTFTFIPNAVGKDTLQVSAFAASVADTFFWIILVEEDISVIPPPVPNVAVEPGTNPSEAVVTWNQVTGATFPLVDYVVKISYDGPINETNWDAATVLGQYDASGNDLGYSVTYTAADDGLVPDSKAWFAVRVLDDRQQLSRLEASYPLEITWAWYLEGRITDDAGLPLLGVIVFSDNPRYSANTDANGTFLFDKPFRNIDSIRVATSSPLMYDFATEPVTAADDTTRIGITLINQYGLGYPECWGGDFLTYRRELTRNSLVGGGFEETRLYTWDQYPISVFIPPMVNDAGVDMEAASLEAMDIWNSIMQDDAAGLGITETDFFVRTSSETAADIVFVFEARPQNYGLVTLLLPSGSNNELGQVVPEKMEVWINTDPALDLVEEVRGVALHELGHTLGLVNHAEACEIGEYLMRPSGGTSTVGILGEIHLDERRATRSIRYIPQGARLSDYSPDRIDLSRSESSFR